MRPPLLGLSSNFFPPPCVLWSFTGCSTDDGFFFRPPISCSLFPFFYPIFFFGPFFLRLSRGACTASPCLSVGFWGEPSFHLLFRRSAPSRAWHFFPRGPFCAGAFFAGFSSSCGVVHKRLLPLFPVPLSPVLFSFPLCLGSRSLLDDVS